MVKVLDSPIQKLEAETISKLLTSTGKPTLVAVLLVGIIWMTCFSVYGADNRLAVNVKKMARNITQQFGTSEVRIAAIQGDKVYLNAGRNKFIWEGAVYQVVTDEEPITDPVSRRKLGNLETQIAEIRIETVRENYSIGQIMDPNGGAQVISVGQKAVEKRTKISIAVMPFEYLNSRDITTPRIAQEIMAAELINTGRFVVAGSAKTAQAVGLIQPDSPGTVQFSKSIGKMLGVEYVLFGFIIDSPGFMEIQCRVHNTADGIGIIATTARIEADFTSQSK